MESLKLQVGEMLQANAQEERDAQLETSKISAKVRGWNGEGELLLRGGCFGLAVSVERWLVVVLPLWL